LRVFGGALPYQIAQDGLLRGRILTGHVKGGLVRYLESQSLQRYIDATEITSQTIQFAIPGTEYTGTGYEATLLLDICDAYLRAREDGALTTKYQRAIANRLRLSPVRAPRSELSR
jgi:hypothetical protein